MSRLVLKRLGLAALPLLGLMGCEQIDPLTRDGLWHPTGANAANLRAMVAVPGDLALGRGTRTADGNAAARAVDRYRAGRTYPLGENSISKVGVSSSAGAPAPAAAPEQ